MKTEINFELLVDNVQDAVEDWDYQFTYLCFNRLSFNPTTKYNYIIENLGWW